MGSEEERSRGWLGRWWSRTRAGRASPDAVEILRRILQPCAGAERAMVELLAEEQGIPWREVRRTIDRLCAEDRIVAYRGPDGIARLSWAERPGEP